MQLTEQDITKLFSDNISLRFASDNGYYSDAERGTKDFYHFLESFCKRELKRECEMKLRYISKEDWLEKLK